MHNLFGRILGPFFEENCGELYFWKFNLSECHLHNIQIYLSTFKIIHAPNCAKLNDRGLHWPYQGHTLKGLRYEKTAVLLWIDSEARRTDPANPAGDHFHCP